MEEISVLESEEGILLYLPHRPNGFRIHGTIVNVCADTKGAHEFGGFMSPSADRLCRICLIERKDIASHPTARFVEMRNKQLQNWNGCPTFRPSNSGPCHSGPLFLGLKVAQNWA